MEGVSTGGDSSDDNGEGDGNNGGASVGPRQTQHGGLPSWGLSVLPCLISYFMSNSCVYMFLY